MSTDLLIEATRFSLPEHTGMKLAANLRNALIANEGTRNGFARMTSQEPALWKWIGIGGFASKYDLTDIEIQALFANLSSYLEQGTTLEPLAAELYEYWQTNFTQKHIAPFFKHIYSYVKLILLNSHADAEQKLLVHMLEKFITQDLARETYQNPTLANMDFCHQLEKVAQFLEAFNSREVPTAESIEELAFVRQTVSNRINGMLQTLQRRGKDTNFFTITDNLGFILRNYEVSPEYPNVGSEDELTLAMIGTPEGTDPLHRTISTEYQKSFISFLKEISANIDSPAELEELREKLVEFINHHHYRYGNSIIAHKCSTYFEKTLLPLVNFLIETGEVASRDMLWNEYNFDHLFDQVRLAFDKTKPEPHPQWGSNALEQIALEAQMIEKYENHDRALRYELWSRLFWKLLMVFRDILRTNDSHEHNIILKTNLGDGKTEDPFAYKTLTLVLVDLIKSRMMDRNWTFISISKELENHELFKELSRNCLSYDVEVFEA